LRFSVLVLPTTYQIPAALILLVGGLLACFAGYRLFRLVLGIYGFVLGALFASSLVSPASPLSMAIIALVGGLIGALILTIGYFIGVALIGAGLGALVAHAVWGQQGWGDPRALPLLAFAVVGAAVALIFQRYVIIIGTGFGGAWTALIGALAMFGDRAAQHPADATNVWIVYPFNLAPAPPWVTGAWLALGILGMLVQLRSKKQK
jgi:hypothetical protein